MDAEPRRRLSREVRRAQLIAAAQRLYAERGYGEVAVEDVARAAGINRAVIYQHFGSRPQLYVATVADARDRFVRRTVRARDTRATDISDRTAAVAAGLQDFFTFLQESTDAWLVLTTPPGPSLEEPEASAVADLQASVSRAAIDYVLALAPDLDPLQAEAMTILLRGATGAVGMWWLERPHVAPEQILAWTTDFLLGGIGPLVDRALDAEGERPANSQE